MIETKTIPTLSATRIAAFHTRYAKGGDCWDWIGATPGKYGVFCIGKANFGAHRVAYLLAFGKDPGALLVCHSCDNPHCVRPDHLFLGTSADNIEDRNSKGRQPKFAPGSRTGERSSANKLSLKQVLEIRGSVLGPSALALQYGVSHSTISLIKSGKRWSGKSHR